MYALYFDCFSGISGDMVLGALMDLGMDRIAFLREMEKLNMGEEFQISFHSAEKNGMKAVKAEVSLLEAHHEEAHHHHRTLQDINDIINDSGLSGKAKRIAKEIFLKIAAAEAKVHGVPVEEVHFHEVGAADSIADVVGAAVLLDMLGADRIFCSPLCEGSGTVTCAHGTMPVPAPATAELCASHQIPLVITEENGEMVTPTGAGIVAAVAESFGKMPTMKNMKIGYGAGTKDLERPNILRVFYGETEDAQEDTFVIETNLDDCTGETVGYTLNKLLRAGALDVWYEQISMKKNRPAVKLSVLCRAQDVSKMERIILSETSSIGVRRYGVERTTLNREIKEVDTIYGTVRVKISNLGDVKKVAPEYDDCKQIALAKDVTYQEVYQAALRNLH